MPAPAISIQPECLQTGHPLPPHMIQLKSYSTDGSVNGKKCGRSRIFTFGPYISVAKVCSMLFKSAIDTPLSM